jgi:LysM repeat protein
MRTKKNSFYLSNHLLIVGLLIFSIVATWLITGLSIPVSAAPDLQSPIFTPTPGPDGRIIYIVKANDTLLSISLISGIPVEQLRTMNHLTDDTIIEGQKLLLGLAGPLEVTPTAGPSPTPVPITPTPTAKPGYANLCVLLFNDQNGDSIRQAEEPSIPDGAISVNNRSGSVSLTSKTISGTDPYCFENISEGDYTISVAVPAGYNATTTTNYSLSLKPGDSSYVDFGAQANAETLSQVPIPTTTDTHSPLLGIVGGLLLIAGLGLAFFAGRLFKTKRI